MLKYITMFFFVLSIGLGYSTYHLTGKLAVSEVANTQLLGKVEKAVKAARLTSESCELSLNRVEVNNKQLDAYNQALQADLAALSSYPLTITPEIKINGPTTPTALPKNADTLRLSPDLMRVLDNAYCSGNKDDSYCTSR